MAAAPVESDQKPTLNPSEQHVSEAPVATRYRVRVRGSAPDQMTETFGDLAVTVTNESNGTGPISTLEGTLRDQAALMGLLNALYSWRLQLLAVQCLEEGSIG
jgi:hypothetical protein